MTQEAKNPAEQSPLSSTAETQLMGPSSTSNPEWVPIPTPLTLPSAGSTSWWQWGITWFLILAVGVIVVLGDQGFFHSQTVDTAPSEEVTTIEEPVAATEAPATEAPTPAVIFDADNPISGITDTEIIVKAQAQNIDANEVSLMLIGPDQKERALDENSVSVSGSNIQITFTVGDAGLYVVRAQWADESDEIKISIQKPFDISVIVKPILEIEPDTVLAGLPADIAIHVQEKGGDAQAVPNQSLVLSFSGKLVEDIPLVTDQDGNVSVSVTLEPPVSGPVTFTIELRDADDQPIYATAKDFQILTSKPSVVAGEGAILFRPVTTEASTTYKNVLSYLDTLPVQRIVEYAPDPSYTWVIIEGWVTITCLEKDLPTIAKGSETCNKAFYLETYAGNAYINLNSDASGLQIQILEKKDKGVKIRVLGLVKTEFLAP